MVPYRASSAKRGKKRSRSMSKSRVLTVADVKRIARSTQETKAEFTNLPSSAVFTTDYTLVNAPPIGTSNYNQRIGQNITAESIEVRGAVAARSFTGRPTACAVMLILDKEPDGAEPLNGDIWELFAGTDPLFGLRNPKYTDRFKILWRQDMVIGPYQGTTDGTASTSSGDPAIVMYHKYLDLSKMLKESERNIRFIDGNGNPSSMGQNAIYHLVLPSNQTAFGETLSTEAPLHYAQTKFSYKDA